MNKKPNRILLIVCITDLSITALSAAKIKNVRLVDAFSLVALGLAAGATLACVVAILARKRSQQR